MMRKFWLVVASRDHVQRGVTGGFMQASHGKQAPLKRMHEGDWIVFYSPKVEFEKPEKLQAFTAVGRLVDEHIYQHDMGGGFVPYRRNVEFQPCQEASILPLIEDLSFIADKTHWGAPFRFGLVEIPAADFRRIAAAMLTQVQLTALADAFAD